MAKFDVAINTKSCKGCKLCIAACPSGCLEVKDNFNLAGYYYPEPVNMDDCTGCGACAKLCPDFCVTVYKYKKTG